MNDVEQRVAAKAFAAYWKDKGYEKGESQSFWLSLLRDVFGKEHPEQFILFEEQVHLDHTSFIDGNIPETKVLIEQKGLGKDLRKPIKQSDGTYLTPFQQAKRYITELPLSQHPRWVVTCNFEKFLVYDMERPGGEPEEILLENLEKEYYRLQFLVDSGNEHLKREMEVSIAAGEIVGLLYDAFAKQYADPTSERAMKSLNVLCVRLVFCLYAEDAGIFGGRGMFHDYLAEFDARKMRRAITDLFKILDTKLEDRDPYLKDDFPELAAFPYVNGGLFANEDIEIPPFTDEIRDLLLTKASSDFDWSEISPTIFGAVFESTLNPETRRSGGMHYTSIENIHKVIDPLFLDELKAEFEEIRNIAVKRTRERKLQDFQVPHISPYLTAAEDILVSSRNKPLCQVPVFKMGNQPIDNGNYLFTKSEMDNFVEKEPNSQKYFRQWLDGAGFLNNTFKYCLWLGGCSPAELKAMPECLKLVKAVKEYREKSNRKSTKKLADTPTRFQTENMPSGNYIAAPEVSSGNRRYIPMGFLDENTFCSNKLRLMSGATLFHFGVLQSNVHMAWTRTVCGYYGPSYQYSINIVYNNFPWPTPTDAQKAKIEQTAQAILDARALYPDSSLAELYDEVLMPPELIRAHQANDRAVMAAYGFTKGTPEFSSESACVASLMRMYQELTK